MHAAFERWWNSISLRTKITGVTVLLLTFGLAVAGVGTANVLRIYLDQQDNDKVAALASGLGQATQDQVLNCRVSYEQGGTLFEVLDSSGDRVCSNVSASEGPDSSRIGPSWSAKNRGDVVTVADDSGREHWRVVPQYWKSSISGAAYVVVIGITTKDTEALVGRYSAIFLGFAIAVIVLGAALTQLLVTSTFSPLRDVERTAARFAAGDYSQRLGGATPNTEVGRLNRSLNTMLARIDMAFADRARTIEQMRRFVGDASHELRTPLVSLRGYAELYRMGAIQKPEDVAQAMDRIEKEAIRMTGLVQDLLELARLDEAKPIELAPVDLLPIAQDAALDVSASYPGRRISVVVPESPGGTVSLQDVTEPVVAQTIEGGRTTTAIGPFTFAGATIARLRRGRRAPARASGAAAAPSTAPVRELPAEGPIVLAQEDRVRQVVTNLMGNAIRYTPEDSPIELVVDVDRAGGFGAISVVDHGEGIPPQLREKIFQRFFRADSSRTRDTGGSGLGLAIVAGIVQNLHGHVEVLETPGGGATFRVSLPLLPSASEPEVVHGSDDAPDVDPQRS